MTATNIEKDKEFEEEDSKEDVLLQKKESFIQRRLSKKRKSTRKSKSNEEADLRIQILKNKVEICDVRKAQEEITEKTDTSKQSETQTLKHNRVLFIRNDEKNDETSRKRKISASKAGSKKLPSTPEGVSSSPQSPLSNILPDNFNESFKNSSFLEASKMVRNPLSSPTSSSAVYPSLLSKMLKIEEKSKLAISSSLSLEISELDASKDLSSDDEKISIKSLEVEIVDEPSQTKSSKKEKSPTFPDMASIEFFTLRRYVFVSLFSDKNLVDTSRIRAFSNSAKITSQATAVTSKRTTRPTSLPAVFNQRSLNAPRNWL
jgi:hypothetical protein